MRETGLFATLKVLSYVVLLSMLLAASYTFMISMINLSAIGV